MKHKAESPNHKQADCLDDIEGLLIETFTRDDGWIKQCLVRATVPGDLSIKEKCELKYFLKNPPNMHLRRFLAKVAARDRKIIAAYSQATELGIVHDIGWIAEYTKYILIHWRHYLLVWGKKLLTPEELGELDKLWK